MASGGSPFEDDGARNSDFMPRSNRRPPRYGTSFDAELSLNSEIQRSENNDRDSLPNNLTWTAGVQRESQSAKKNKKSREFQNRQYSDADSPPRFTRKKHTPATLPRTKFSSGAASAAQLREMDKLKQHLTFSADEEREVGAQSRENTNSGIKVSANNEKNAHGSSKAALIRSQTNQNGVPSSQSENGYTGTSAAAIDSSKILDRLKQVREYLRQATSLFIALNSQSTTPDEATDEDLEQMDKLAKLIKHLKTQEKAYVDLAQRSIAVRDSSIENTPSTSVVSLDGDPQFLDDTTSNHSDELEGLRQQHALLRKMVEQQRQLKELQDRQNTLLELQRAAETQLKEAEAEGMRISGLVNGAEATGVRLDDLSSISGRSRSETERSDDPQPSQLGAVGGQTRWKRSSEDVVRRSNRDEQVQRSRKFVDEQKPENLKNQKPARNQATLAYESTESATPDNEAQALAMADAAQERLELESKLMDLQAKKRQMDTLVEQLQQLREMQLGKELALSQGRSVNETRQNGEEDVRFTTRSAKDTGDNVDDEKILEALQLHKKLRKLQDVKDKLEKLKDLFGEQQGSSEQADRRERRGGTEETASESARGSVAEDGDERMAALEMPPGSLDWILNSGIDDPELIAKLRQVKAAKERVANLKHLNGQTNVPLSSAGAEGGSGCVQAVAEDEDSGVLGETDNETSGSVSSSLMWQEDPEFQEKLRKLNAARKKLRRLQELVKKTEELPRGASSEPYLPAELADISFSSDEGGEENGSGEEGAAAAISDAVNENEESDDEATSETLVEVSRQTPSRMREGDAVVDTELGYMDKLSKQRAALNDLMAEKQKLLETQEHLRRLRLSDAVTQTRPPATRKELDTFIHNPTEVGTSRQGPTVDSATQTITAPNPRAKHHEQRQDALPSNSLLWLELRRQRELQEQKLKKRKEILMLERKRRRSGLENGSEDEGFGRSALSADITTATWGGSTQMSSTQNDSAVSDQGSSHETDEEILVQVEDEASDGIVQAEEEEEANSETEIFPSSSGSRKPFQKNTGSMKQNSREKRLLFEGLRKRDLERHERFKGWQNSLFPSGNKKRSKRSERFSNAEELAEISVDEMYMRRERTMWERQFDLQQRQMESTTSLCNTLLRDQQTLISLLLNRMDVTTSSAFDIGPTSFSQYQQRQQEALQGIQNYFDQQRFLVQQQQMLQNLTECYSQMQQQHEDMLHLQKSFSQLFSTPSSQRRQTTAPPNSASTTPFGADSSRTPNSFTFRPEIFVKETPPSTPFNQRSSAAREAKAPEGSTAQAYSFGRSSLTSGLRNRGFQFVGSTNPDTGVPSPGDDTLTFGQSGVPVKPVSARVVGAEKRSPGNPSLAYNSVSYADPKPSSSNVVVGKQFPTPLRATAAAILAEQDKTGLRGVKRRREDDFQDKIDTESLSSHQSSLPGDSEKPGTESDAASDYSLFEALRDSIYSEVATLISQNESRPHFLIELFRELQLLSSDYLRQRALYSLRDLVTRFLKDDPPGGTIESTLGNYPWVLSGSEQTPSESAGFSETDQDQDKKGKVKVPEVLTQDIYDYAEAVESGSTLSTPNSGNHEPFASEFLGETVIHLDKALKSMRDRECRDSESSSVGASGQAAAAGVQSEEVTSSAGDVASESSSLPDIQYPKIDTQALDRQIKKIMAEVIPCLNDRMEETCTVELLEYIREMVMSMIQQKNEAREFRNSGFFHKQLESILQDSLAKFIGKRMKDCGEDLLVDISEILFNELAFFKLMQELDGGVTKAKFFSRDQKYRVSSPATRNNPPEDKILEISDGAAERKEKDEEDPEDELDIQIQVENENEEEEEQEAEESHSSESSDWQIIEEKREEEKQEDAVSREQLEKDEEALGRDRDDAMAEEFDELRGHFEAAATESSQCVKVVELSVSESKPLASNGSEEEDESELEIEVAECGLNEENAEGASWGNEHGSQMAAAASSDREEGASSGSQNKQDEEQDDDLPTKFTGLTEADLQVKIAEEQSRNDGIHGIVLSIDNGEELAGDPNHAPEPEGSELVNGDMDGPEK